MSRSRTNIEIDDENVARVMERFELRTKTDAVNLALEWLALKPMNRAEALAMYGARLIDEVPGESPIEEL